MYATAPASVLFLPTRVTEIPNDLPERAPAATPPGKGRGTGCVDRHFGLPTQAIYGLSRSGQGWDNRPQFCGLFLVRTDEACDATALSCRGFGRGRGACCRDRDG